MEKTTGGKAFGIYRPSEISDKPPPNKTTPRLSNNIPKWVSGEKKNKYKLIVGKRERIDSNKKADSEKTSEERPRPSFVEIPKMNLEGLDPSVDLESLNLPQLPNVPVPPNSDILSPSSTEGQIEAGNDAAESVDILPSADSVKEPASEIASVAPDVAHTVVNPEGEEQQGFNVIEQGKDRAISATQASEKRESQELRSHPRPNKQSLRDAFKHLRNKPLMSSEAAEALKAKIQAACSHLPEGVTLNGAGYFSGSHIKQVPNRLVDGSLLKCLVTAFDIQGDTDPLAKAEFNIIKSAKPIFENGNIEMNYDDGPYFLKDAYPKGQEQLTNARRALFALVGNKNMKLSKLLIPEAPMMLLQCINSPTGALLADLNVLGGTNGANYTISRKDGSAESLGINTNGPIDATIEIKKNLYDDSIEVNYDWSAYCLPAQHMQEILPMNKNEVISVRLEATFHFSALDLESMEMLFTMPKGIKTTFEGRLRLD